MCVPFCGQDVSAGERAVALLLVVVGAHLPSLHCCGRIFKVPKMPKPSPAVVQQSRAKAKPWSYDSKVCLAGLCQPTPCCFGSCSTSQIHASHHTLCARVNQLRAGTYCFCHTPAETEDHTPVNAPRGVPDVGCDSADHWYHPECYGQTPVPLSELKPVRSESVGDCSVPWVVFS